MLGKKSSLSEIRKYLLYEKQIKNISETRFCQGHTMRWAIAWSFSEQQIPIIDYSNVCITVWNRLTGIFFKNHFY